jgi:glycerol kinase
MILAIDQGTSGSTCIVFDEQGRPPGAPTASSASTSRGPGGWSTMPTRSERSRAPVLRSHATTVSRWFVIPIPARVGLPARSTASFATQADMLGVPVVVPEVSETTALGAAYLAGVAVGAWSEEDVAGMWRQAARYEPSMSEDERDTLLAGWQAAVERARGR